MIIEQPTESFPNYTYVDFAVILRQERSSKPKMVENTTLEYIIQKSANSISKHLGGYETVYVNNLRPLSDVRCNEKDDSDVRVETHNQVLTATTISGVIVLAVVVVASYYR